MKFKSNRLTLALASSVFIFSNAVVAASAPLVSIATHDSFFDSIKAHCGKAYQGKVTLDNASGDGFANKKLIMHVRRCSESKLEIPFHVGDDASRTWIITKTGSGLSLKHDHRLKDGSYDVSTMYGGHTVVAGYAQAQAFPADEYSKQLFIKTGIPQSMGNTWQMFIYPEQFTYRLTRQGREFRVDFDLTTPIATPAAPWGYTD
ncbi:hypothetical protein SAMN05216262_10134 [Colwellia chukchiensis]|uniref:Secreted protein n=1 Tax=Colwellia chukchiensis TaxID=641665 RepID=A0A1H7G099_9GAMM|nr:hypothetical protein [Colwellia chukchiensis]SEK30937.1 hypothetical protein SAMN05216262_10134 [Colwellia chukchiensis]